MDAGADALGDEHGEDGLGKIFKETIARTYVEQLSAACRGYKIPLGDVEYSEKELRRALDEIDIDVRAIFMRRGGKSGISASKISGIVAFRLSRFKILHFQKEALQHEQIHEIQDVVALSIVLARILRKEISGPHIRELAYQMARRHANQETLGLVFDIVMTAS